ncbi:hypothetical protein K435DRAFT_880845 [Dendrothele bispora CBS 962.96]|uniref:Uncharacterized protein n=1 Tax=Dendrothele bispora (strain CBS 962.96) TaxID=1314807 RepID=A0A4S8KJB4_DENBC|nr:hypothetical protein K435DRAFT_880845 [Dendrothele bispora CBS 962.96]
MNVSEDLRVDLREVEEKLVNLLGDDGRDRGKEEEIQTEDDRARREKRLWVFDEEKRWRNLKKKGGLIGITARINTTFGLGLELGIGKLSPSKLELQV